MVGRLTHIPLETVWAQTGLGVRRWLESNRDALGDTLGIVLMRLETGQSAGASCAELVAEAEDGKLVVIEPQLKESDHTRLGKLITCLAMLAAETAVWIVATARPEHVQAMTWLNESSKASFYMLKIEAVEIDDSAPAPLLTLIVGPGEEACRENALKQDRGELRFTLRRFWMGLLKKARPKTQLHISVSPDAGNWLSTGAGRTGLTYAYVVRSDDAQVQLSIDGRGDPERSSAILDALAAHREQIERTFGGRLQWECVPGKAFCRIKYAISGGGYRDEENWPFVQDQMIEAMMRLEKALSPRIAQLTL